MYERVIMRTKKIGITFILIFLIVGLISCGKTNNNQPFVRVPMQADELADVGLAPIEGNYQLAWSDEFDYEGSLDATKWNYATGNGSGGWGNNELQYYTSRNENANVDNGILTITAKRENYGGCDYTSSRINSSGKWDFTYGYVEFKAKLPTGKGTWPALWMMPTDSEYGIWPKSGEIDVMETTGYNPSKVLGTIHTGSYNHILNTQKGSYTNVPASTTSFNTYGMEWDENTIKISVNGIVYFTYIKDSRLDQSSTGYMAWPFDKDFHLIMNIAMGGAMGGNVDPTFQEAKMEVDYVRVYKKVDESDKEAPSIVDLKSSISTGSSIHLEWTKATDNQGVKQYEVVVNGKQVAATIKNYYTIEDLLPNKQYQIRIIAVDWNDNYSITPNIGVETIKAQNVPGSIKGIAYNQAENVLVMNGSDTDQSQVLRFSNDAFASYDTEMNLSKECLITLRASIVKNCILTIQVLADNVLVGQETINEAPSYGKYKDIALTNIYNLPKGEITIKITCKADTTGNAMLLNYIKVE